MSEEMIIRSLKEQGIDLVAELPCDRNKRLTRLLTTSFRTVHLTREEDGVGICAGAFLAGGKPVLSIQSSGLGNMLNALMSLTAYYHLPLPILASWRGVCQEPIEAQIPFNEKLTAVLEAYGIYFRIFSSPEELCLVGDVVRKAYADSRICVALMTPDCWTPSDPELPDGSRKRLSSLDYLREIPEPTLSRRDAVSVIAAAVDDETILVSNIGVPSKELYASKDRPLNFYMLGSYTQASPIGLGMALCSRRKVVVLDGDGSLLGSAVLPVVADMSPENLTIVCLDNGTFGSTGNQKTQAYHIADPEMAAQAAGIRNTCLCATAGSIRQALAEAPAGPRFIRVMITPGNSDAPNISLPAADIKQRFMTACRADKDVSQRKTDQNEK